MEVRTIVFILLAVCTYALLVFIPAIMNKKKVKNIEVDFKENSTDGDVKKEYVKREHITRERVVKQLEKYNKQSLVSAMFLALALTLAVLVTFGVVHTFFSFSNRVSLIIVFCVASACVIYGVARYYKKNLFNKDIINNSSWYLTSDIVMGKYMTQSRYIVRRFLVFEKHKIHQVDLFQYENYEKAEMGDEFYLLMIPLKNKFKSRVMYAYPKSEYVCEEKEFFRSEKEEIYE